MAELFASKSYVDELKAELAEVKSQVQNLQLEISNNNVNNGNDLVSRQDEAFSCFSNLKVERFQASASKPSDVMRCLVSMSFLSHPSGRFELQ